ncbi:MAG: hypothetical protein LBT32_07875 [Peptococcaceae bacterium]|jgi:hypothetical protein|nr:hypothetical protein [Peptococcaceae bacterium]
MFLKRFHHARSHRWGLPFLGVVGAFFAGRAAEKHQLLSVSTWRDKFSSLAERVDLPLGHGETNDDEDL